LPDDSTIAGSLQESIITALVYFTDSNTKIISRLVDINWFEDPYREICAKILEYWRQEDRAPEAHIDDVLDNVLNNPTHQKYNTYTRIINRLLRLSQTLNTKYVCSRLAEFSRRQNLKRAIFEAGTILSQSDNPEDYDKVEAILAAASRFQYNGYDLGFSLAETDKSLTFLDNEEDNDRLPIGIEELDREGINPGRGELFLMIAPRGRGKSQFIHHVGRQCLAARGKWQCLHISLENSAKIVAQRYMQGRFAITTRETTQGIILFSRDNNRNVTSFEQINNPATFIPREEQREYLETKVNYYEQYDHQMSRLRIKDFPTGDLSYDKLEAFLENLESRHNFAPSLLLLDYPDLMALDNRHDPRLAIGRLYQQLRGLAVKRNMAIVVVSQSNREGENAKLIELSHAAEDISKVATADTVISLNQTKQEQQLGIGRLYVAKARNQKQWYSVLISQNYSASQFCVDSALMPKKPNYDNLFNTVGPIPEC
jgi:replicative DNA helicase